ncbi:MAG: hypothetical protein ABSA30_00275 [Candidatus Aminicenantales bacterium]|jgi:hypothetical protein
MKGDFAEENGIIGFIEMTMSRLSDPGGRPWLQLSFDLGEIFLDTSVKRYNISNIRAEEAVNAFAEGVDRFVQKRSRPYVRQKSRGEIQV